MCALRRENNRISIPSSLAGSPLLLCDPGSVPEGVLGRVGTGTRCSPSAGNLQSSLIWPPAIIPGFLHMIKTLVKAPSLRCFQRCELLPCLWLLVIPTACTSLTCGAQVPRFPPLTAAPLSAWRAQSEWSCFCPRQELWFLIAHGAVLRQELFPGQAHPVLAHQICFPQANLACSVLDQGCKSLALGHLWLCWWISIHLFLWLEGGHRSV